jgi:tungstate transport system ATP-binding protein
VYKIRGLRHTYGPRTVLQIPSLDIGPDELLALVGPSGAGKSTLLRLLHFLEEPSDGQVVYSRNGTSHDFPIPIEVRREIGMVFQRPELIDGSVWDNVALGLRFRGRFSPQPVEEAIRSVELEHLSQAHVGSLSGGELQRVALARVMACAPRLYLLDEPTANLDPRNVGLVEAIIRKMRLEGAAVVLVTHNVYQARRLAERVGLIISGELVEVSTVQTFFDDPSDSRARAFVRGEMVF